MPDEIERKFLLAFDRLPSGGRSIEQGYLGEGVPSVRVRRHAAGATLTVKGAAAPERGAAECRPEIEVAIPEARARDLLALATGILVKRRCRVGPWEVDVYGGRLEGLVVAEVELGAADDPLPAPPEGWTLVEVTGEPPFSNRRLAHTDRRAAARRVGEARRRLREAGADLPDARQPSAEGTRSA